ncbi:hypothetical protein [Synechocystis sp. LKSZ1]|uniref:hypothetical protein n=1 Tax=Synechocystis sp. LKSZ1 TaxID=3144951 RepID=UPI00336BB266
MLKCLRSLRGFWPLQASLLLVLLLSSCAETQKAQCQKLILVTKNMAQEAAQYRTTTKPEDTLAIASAFEKMAQKLQDLKFSDTQLSSYQQNLAEVYLGNATATRSMVKAIQEKDILTARLAQAQVKQIGQREQQVITQMNQYCQTP